MKEVPILAYKKACKYGRYYPESWNRDKQAGRKWSKLFVAKHEQTFSKFTSVCKNEMSNTENKTRPTIFTKKDEQLLLTQLQEMETRHGCKCKSCVMKQISILAYKIARKYKRNYPESWNRDKQAGKMWVRFFVTRNKDEISEFSSVCTKELTVLTKKDEQFLLTQLQEMETQEG